MATISFHLKPISSKYINVSSDKYVFGLTLFPVNTLHLSNTITAGRQDTPLNSLVIILLYNLNCVTSSVILLVFRTSFKFRKVKIAKSTLSLMI